MKRITALGIFLLVWAGSQAQDTSTQLDHPISIEYKQKTLFQVWSNIEEKYPIQFFYKEEWIPRSKFSGDFSNVPIKTILTEQLAGTGLGFTNWNDRSILIARESEIAQVKSMTFKTLITETLNMDETQSLRKRAKGKNNVIGDSTLRPLPATATLTGRVFESNTDIGLANASISFPDLQQGGLTDTSGTFLVKIPTGYHRTIVKATGRETREFGIWVYSDGEWDIELNFTAFQMEEVLLSAEGEDRNVSQTQAGVVKISPIDIRRMPNLLGEIDVLKSITLIPGVSSAGEAASGFNVRGGNIDQNLVMQDGNMIFNSSHLLGFFSLFNPDLIKDITLYKGHIPAQYGGRTSSVLDVQLDEGSYRKTRGRASIGILASKLSLGGPMQKNKSSYLLGIRAAYPNVATSFVDNHPDIQRSAAYYGDATLKLTQKLGDLGKISFTGYASTDVFNFGQQFGYGWRTVMGGINWKQIYEKGWSSTVQVNTSSYQSSFFDNNDVEAFEITSGLSQTNLKAYGLWPLNSQHTLRIGTEFTWYDIADNIRNPYGSNSIVRPKSVEKDQGLESGIYINDEWKINNFFSLDMGLRLSGFANLGPSSIFIYPENSPREVFNIIDTLSVGEFESVRNFGGIEPRISFKANLNELTSVKVGFNRIHQYSHLLINSLATTPVDLWQLSNRYFPAQVANSFFAGVHRNFFGNIWQLSLEGYFRQMKGLVVNRDFANLFVNDHIETEIMDAEGVAYGGEFSLIYSRNKFDVQMSYAYSRSLRRAIGDASPSLVNGGKWFPSDIDMPHNITFTGQWRAKRTVTYSMNFVYRSGRPVTAPEAVYGIEPSWLVPAFSDRNAFRIPPFHRLDFGATLDRETIKRNRVKSEFVFSIYNFYARHNPFSVFFRREGGRYQGYQLAVIGSLLPMISYNFRF
ncbi:MAG: TonB-dependent receptor plug domain-containing protein [Bacteroidota bacterium]